MDQDALYKYIVSRAIALIDPPERWTRQAQARDCRNQPCPAWYSEATKWCFFGAMVKAAFESCGDPACALATANRVRHLILGSVLYDLVKVNDANGRDAVIALVRTTYLGS